MKQKFEIIDAQMHPYEHNHPGRPWVGHLEGPEEASGETLVKEMEAVGVDGSILVSAYNKYGFDPSYALDVFKKYPNKFRVIRPFDMWSETIEDDLESWSKINGVVGARLMLTANEKLIDSSVDSTHQGVNRFMKKASEIGIAINVMASGQLDHFAAIAKSNPNTQLVLDHLGLMQPHVPPVPDIPIGSLDSVLELAQFDNVAIKVSGACTLSKLPYPYQDIWNPIHQVINSYGLNRCIWGTDWTRAVRILPFKESVHAFIETDQLSEDEKIQLMGENLKNIYGW